MEKQLYLLEMPYHLASWHKWAQELYKYAEQYEHHIFDREGIEAFAQELNEKAKTLRNAKPIGKPDIDGDVHYLGYASLNIPNEYFYVVVLVSAYASKEISPWAGVMFIVAFCIVALLVIAILRKEGDDLGRD